MVRFSSSQLFQFNCCIYKYIKQMLIDRGNLISNQLIVDVIFRLELIFSVMRKNVPL
jgi:hypothetical protein